MTKNIIAILLTLSLMWQQNQKSNNIIEILINVITMALFVFVMFIFLNLNITQKK